jgi:hypothetical protein
MATGNSNFNTLITTTLQNHGKEIFDAASGNNALGYLLKEKGNIKVVGGGRKFTHPLIYAVNSSFKAYAKDAVIDTPITDNATRAEYDVKYLSGSIVLSMAELAMNAGSKEKLLDLAEEKKMEAEISMSELLGSQVFASGTGNDFDGLGKLISTTPSTQTDVGGIDASAAGNTYWRNQIDATGTGAFNTSLAGLKLMNGMLNSCTFGKQGPKAVLTTKTVYGLYEIGLTSNIRYTDTKLADAGFQNLRYTTMPIMFDDNVSLGYMYFVDTDSLWLQVLSQGNMQVTQFQQSQDQLVSSSLMYLFGNLTCGSRRTQGLLTGITA